MAGQFGEGHAVTEPLMLHLLDHDVLAEPERHPGDLLRLWVSSAAWGTLVVEHQCSV